MHTFPTELNIRGNTQPTGGDGSSSSSGANFALKRGARQERIALGSPDHFNKPTLASLSTQRAYNTCDEQLCKGRLWLQLSRAYLAHICYGTYTGYHLSHITPCKQYFCANTEANRCRHRNLLTAYNKDCLILML